LKIIKIIMALGKDELKKEIAAILKDADLSTISSKKVRQQIEEKLDIDLNPRKKEVDQLVMDFIEKGKKNGAKADDDDDDDEENEDEDEEDEASEEEDKKPKRGAPKKAAAKRKKSSSDESEDQEESDEDDEYSPKKKPAAKKAAKKGGRKKKGSDDSDEDWGKAKRGRPAKKAGGAAAGGAKRTGSGYTRSLKLSTELAALVGQESMARHEVVKRVWAIIKERNLYDPKNKQFAICDEALLKVFGVKRFRTFGMMKFLKNHFLE